MRAPLGDLVAQSRSNPSSRSLEGMNVARPGFSAAGEFAAITSTKTFKLTERSAVSTYCAARPSATFGRSEDPAHDKCFNFYSANVIGRLLSSH